MFKWFNLARRLSELEDQMLKLTRVVGDRDLDWEEMRARCKRLLDRTEKAARRVVQSEEEVSLQPPEEGGNHQEGTTQVASAFLTPRQKMIQQQVLRRRMGMGLK